jgi:hypothetical protein
MDWCCRIFQGWFQQAGSRGLAVFVSTKAGPEPAFILQYRALDPGREAPYTDYPLSSVVHVQIQFCPWCGANLKNFYRDTFRELDRPNLSN